MGVIQLEHEYICVKFIIQVTQWKLCCYAASKRHLIEMQIVDILENAHLTLECFELCLFWTMKDIFICLFHSGPQATPTVVCVANVSVFTAVVWSMSACCRPAVSELDDIPRKPVRWPHKRCDQRCLPDSWHTELTLQNNPILATAVVFSLRPILPISCLCTSSCYPNEPDFHINILTLTGILSLVM